MAGPRRGADVPRAASCATSPSPALGFDRELPWRPGTDVEFQPRSCPPTVACWYRPRSRLQAEVVSIEPGHTGLRLRRSTIRDQSRVIPRAGHDAAADHPGRAQGSRECAILGRRVTRRVRGRVRGEYEIDTADRRSGDQRRDAFRHQHEYAGLCGRADGALLRVRGHLGAGPAARPRAAVYARGEGVLPPGDPELRGHAETHGDGPCRGSRPCRGWLYRPAVRRASSTDQTRAVRELVHGHQRRLLLAERPAALDRRQSWLQR